MKEYKVIDPAGIHHGVEHRKKGAKFESPSTSQVKAWLRFGQIEVVSEKAQDPDADAKGK